ncbi:MAG TPA: UDP-N-acetylmuramoyl-tripeptide--D-alanyl-D-alanine ligase [Caldisericia bacterium]|nr:UDP-N-acetylmuramoyl-tripeptide--D-alanyl-D-alanine ligase [Caldisericia bacterium]
MEIFNLILNFIFITISFFIFLINLLWYLQVLQILEYFNLKFLRWIKRNYISVFLKNYLLLFIILINFISIFISKNNFFNYFLKIFSILLLLIVLLSNYKIFKKRKKLSKKGLVFTKRLNRVLYLNITVFILFIFLIYLLIPDYIYLSISIYLYILPIIVLLLNIIILPFEKLINNYYFNDAIKKIEKLNPFIIAITGSYGKTSTKFFINQMLKKKLNTFMTPESYNTAMGLTKVIRNDLKEDDKIFIVELAENEVGGFKRLLKLIKPNISVVTSVGIQHLEEFGKEEKIYKEIDYFINYSINYKNCELIVLNGDNDFLSKYSDEKIKKCSIEKKLDFYGKIIETNLSGSKFKLFYKNEEIFCETKIIGKENLRNILIASFVAYNMGLSLNEIAEFIKNLEPPPHRLNIIDRGNILVIDDAYNSNPIGARMAIDLLSTYNNGRKNIITPGFIDLGKKEFEENKKLGEYMINKVDYVFLVGGKRTNPIYKGLIEKNFIKENVFIFKNFYEANEFLKKFLKPFDAILFENDLPEIFEEI